MKIAWFTPFSKKGGIGEYSRSATEALKKYCHIDLFLFEKENLLETTLNKFFYKKEDDLTKILAEYDLVIYNLGNNIDFHLEIYEISKKYKGIIILHDIVMHHFFLGYYLKYKKSREAYHNQIKYLYGEKAFKLTTDSLNQKIPPIWMSKEMIHYPLFEKAIEGALGVITHSDFAANKVEEKFLSPVANIYFPSFKINYSKSTHKNIDNLNEKILLLTFGDVNANKRIDKVIKVIGERAEIKTKVSYIVIGSSPDPSYWSQLESLIKEYNLQQTVHLLGYQENEVLHSYIEKADIFINLRYPAMEGASASLVHQLYAGKPILVTDNGCYSELPDSTVIKVRPDHEINDIYYGVNKLVENKMLREIMGKNARTFAESRFNQEAYCQRFLAFARKIVANKQ